MDGRYPRIAGANSRVWLWMDGMTRAHGLGAPLRVCAGAASLHLELSIQANDRVLQQSSTIPCYPQAYERRF